MNDIKNNVAHSNYISKAGRRATLLKTKFSSKSDVIYIFQADIQAAVDAVKKAVAVCDRLRKKQSILSRTNFADFMEGKKYKLHTQNNF